MIFKFKNKTFKSTKNSDGSLTFSYVNVSSMKLSSLLEIPWSGYSWSVKENFNCYYNELTNLSGCPTFVGGDFYCHSNELTNLSGCPTSVGGDFYCHSNELSNLEGCPTSVGRNFYCRDNKLTSLIGCLTSIKGEFKSDNFSHEDYLSYIMKLKVNQLQSL